MLDFLQNKKEEVSLLIDIGNGSITSALVLFNKDLAPEFLYTVKVPLVVIEKPDISKLVEEMYSMLDKMLDTLMKQGFKNDYFNTKSKKIDHVLVTLCSPWFVLKTKHISLSKEQPFLITKSFLDDIVSKEEEIFKKELLKSAPEDADPKDLPEVIEKSIVHTKINGYALENSVGNKTTNFDAFLCMSAISSSLENKVLKIILKHTHASKDGVMIHTFPTVSFSVIRDIFNSDSDFMLVDITSEIIDITLVKDDVITQTITIPSGRNFIIRQIAKTFNVSPEIAESTLHLYIDKKADDSVDVGMKNIISNIEKEWIVYFENAVSNLPEGTVVPSKAYLTADYDVLDLNLNFLKLMKNNIIHMTEENLSHLYKAEPKVKVDQFVLMLALFYKKIMKN